MFHEERKTVLLASGILQMMLSEDAPWIYFEQSRMAFKSEITIDIKA